MHSEVCFALFEVSSRFERLLQLLREFYEWPDIDAAGWSAPQYEHEMVRWFVIVVIVMIVEFNFNIVWGTNLCKLLCPLHADRTVSTCCRLVSIQCDIAEVASCGWSIQGQTCKLCQTVFEFK